MLMTLMLITFISLISSLLVASNPLSMGLTILLIALSLTMIFAMTLSSWFSFLIFLIYVGGLLVMFAYFMALMPNQELLLNYPLIVTTMFSYSLICFFMIPPLSFSSDNPIHLFCNHNWPCLLILAFVLLYAMVIIVKITSTSKGPLRPFL